MKSTVAPLSKRAGGGVSRYGPVDVLAPDVTGVLDADLRRAALGALEPGGGR